MGIYSIKEVETLSGIKAHTLRIWEQRYDFLRPERTDTNIRHYTDEQLKLILNVATLNRSGMKISKIAAMDEKERAENVLKSYELTTEPDSLTDSLIYSMLDFDEKRFEKALSSAIVKLGFEDAFSRLIIPFLIRTGVLCSAGAFYLQSNTPQDQCCYRQCLCTGKPDQKEIHTFPARGGKS